MAGALDEQFFSVEQVIFCPVEANPIVRTCVNIAEHAAVVAQQKMGAIVVVKTKGSLTRNLLCATNSGQCNFSLS